MFNRRRIGLKCTLSFLYTQLVPTNLKYNFLVFDGEILTVVTMYNYSYRNMHGANMPVNYTEHHSSFGESYLSAIFSNGFSFFSLLDKLYGIIQFNKP